MGKMPEAQNFLIPPRIYLPILLFKLVISVMIYMCKFKKNGKSQPHQIKYKYFSEIINNLKVHFHIF